MNEFSLTGKTILVTGASSGIGKKTALLISRYGATVCITGKTRERLDKTFQQLSQESDAFRVTNVIAIPSTREKQRHAQFLADLTKEKEMDQVINDLPALNGIVHCAGIVGPLPVKFIKQGDIDRMFGINFYVPVNLTGKILRKKKLLDHASVLFISTIATRNPYYGGALYSSSKAALEAYSKTLALELVSRGIRSNCLLAGLVKTPMIENPSEKDMEKEALERYLKRYPLGIGEPEDVAATILFFLSDASKWITGTSLILGGE